MSTGIPKDNPELEQRLARLLDGDLSDAELARLHADAATDPELVSALTDTLALQTLLGELPVQRAPASLRRRLRVIPYQQWQLVPSWRVTPRWLGACAVLLLAIVLLGKQHIAEQPDPEQLRIARHELALALAYLDRANRQSAHLLETTIERGVNRPITEHTVTPLAKQLAFDQEYPL